MIPLVKNIFHALLWDPMAVRRWLRGLAVAFALGGATFGDQVAEVIGHGVAGKSVKIAALLLGFIGGAISVGQPQPKPDAQLVPPEPPKAA